ncbi:MAG: hypothetical protein AAF502_25480 [Bacteroidota bacterium]
MKYLIIIGTLLLSFSFSESVQGQHPEDPFAGSFFDPGLVIDYAKEIGLSTEVRKELIEQITDAQKTFALKQFDLEDKMEVLIATTKQDKIDQAAAQAQLEEVLDLEKEIKTAQLMLMVNIKNRLTPKQQEKLREIQRNLGR